MNRSGKQFILALQFLTKITLKRDISYTDQELGQSAVWFPAVGLVLGLILVLLNILLSYGLPEPIVNILLITAQIALTGGLHLDGLIDLADGLYAGDTPQRVQEVMRDTHVGSMGLITLFVVLILKLFSLNAIDAAYKNHILLIMPTLSRWCALYTASRYKYARQETGTGQVFTKESDQQGFLKASILPILLCIVLMGAKGVWLVMMVFFTTVALGTYLNKRIGGMTGDSLGAVNEIIEVTVLLYSLIIIQPG
jgi:adenosylcobinamide-GDP ribazoletransferase